MTGFTGCSTTGLNSGTGFALFNIETTEGELVTAHKSGTKEGRGCTSNILGIYASGDASISATAKLAGITNISTVERQYTNYLVYGKMCTIVTGN